MTGSNEWPTYPLECVTTAARGRPGQMKKTKQLLTASVSKPTGNHTIAGPQSSVP